MMIYCLCKRWMDICLCIIALLVVGPFLLLSALLIKCTSKGPVLFFQERVGLNGQLFRIMKMRTMYVDPCRTPKQTLGTDPDVVPVGRVMRRLKIDELPQIFNVILGDMSIVGPRPCLLHTYEEMPHWARRRARVKPGLTGLAQVNGNIALSWEDRWRFDVQYVERQSLSLDIGIILRTFLVVLIGEDKFKRNK